MTLRQWPAGGPNRAVKPNRQRGVCAMVLRTIADLPGIADAERGLGPELDFEPGLQRQCVLGNRSAGNQERGAAGKGEARCGVISPKACRHPAIRENVLSLPANWNGIAARAPTVVKVWSVVSETWVSAATPPVSSKLPVWRLT